MTNIIFSEIRVLVTDTALSRTTNLSQANFEEKVVGSTATHSLEGCASYFTLTRSQGKPSNAFRYFFLVKTIKDEYLSNVPLK